MKIFKSKPVKTPVRGTSKSAGLDFFVPQYEFSAVIVEPQQQIQILSGIHAKVPEGYMLVANNKSGVAKDKGLIIGACVVDEDYQGEISIHLWNVSDKPTAIVPGEKLVQFILVPVSYEGVELSDSLKDLYGSETTERGAGGFGSTGKA